MKWRRFSIFLLLMSWPGAALAHHCNASYDRDHQSKLKGTVVEFRWTNPHIEIIFDVSSRESHAFRESELSRGSEKGQELSRVNKVRAGAMERWIGEGPSPSQMMENGWTKETLKPGDRISVVGNPPKSGAASVRLRWVTLPNGRDLFAYNN